jgi:hypothetical protein
MYRQIRIIPCLKEAPHYEGTGGGEGIALCFLTIDLKGRRLTASMPGPFTPGKPRYPLNRRLRGPKGGCVRCTEKRDGECSSRRHSANFTLSGEVNTILAGNIEAGKL